MKKLSILFCIIASVILYGCRTKYPVAQESGKDDVAYLLFISMNNNDDIDVDVSIDGTTNFKARTVKLRKANRKGSQYSVKPGSRKLTVTYNGKVLYNKTVFLSNQETKKIELP